MDIWHKLGKIFRLSNIGTILFFMFNILLILNIFSSYGYTLQIIILYFVIVVISVSSLGELMLAYFAGARDIRRVDIKLRVIPLVQYVLDRAKNQTLYSIDNVKVMIIYDEAPNAFALGRRTICVTKGLLNLPDELILGVLAHEVGHLAYGHTMIQLLIGGGNVFIMTFLSLLKLVSWLITGTMGLFAIGSHNKWLGAVTALFAGISAGLLWLWIKFCNIFLMWSKRQNEFLADEFAFKIGFGQELAQVIDQQLCDVPRTGFFRALYNTHPYNDDRVAALQNLGVPYRRY